MQWAGMEWDKPTRELLLVSRGSLGRASFSRGSLGRASFDF